MAKWFVLCLEDLVADEADKREESGTYPMSVDVFGLIKAGRERERKRWRSASGESSFKFHTIAIVGYVTTVS